MVTSVNLILRTVKDEKLHYLLQLRDLGWQHSYGNAPFIFPGTFCLPGGDIEDGESVSEGLEREIHEEIPSLDLSSLSMEHRVYDLSKYIDKIFVEIASSYNGNVPALLGFGLDDYVPQEALGKLRGQQMTYRQWMARLTEYHVFSATIPYDLATTLKSNEGKGLVMLPAEVCKALVMVPSDKIVLLDDLARLKNT